ncbi:MAG: ribosome maturation factor RimP [Desulfovibrio sp.]|jgi:ribosome maturation factor RimP|nr:ribosome maturation factor RimP [Desulfovibrio sp.]
MGNLTDKIAALAAPLARSLGLALWGVEVDRSQRPRVRVFVEDIGIDQCAGLSRLLSLSLDAEDLISGPYVLEVSSPGMDRVFFTPEQLSRAVGALVDLTLFEDLPAFPGRRRFRGVVNSADAEVFSLRLTQDDPAQEAAAAALEEISFNFAAVRKVRQVPVFPEKVLPGKGRKKSLLPANVENDKTPSPIPNQDCGLKRE